MVDPDEALVRRAIQVLGPRLHAHAAADADAALEALCEAAGAVDSRETWMARVDAAIATRVLASTPDDKDTAGKPRSQAVCEAVQEFLRQATDPILICDGGEFGQWAQAYCTAPTRVVNGVSGAIGGSLCYAVAASLARPDATVVALLGDGTVGFHLSEYETAAREGARFVAVVGNDARWNAEHVIQLREYGAHRLYGCALGTSVRYDAAAQALGGHGAHVASTAALAAALAEALATGLPACVNVEIDGQAAPVFASGGILGQGPH